MKKVFISLCAIVLALTTAGCQKTGFKEGTYNGSSIDNYGGVENTATAKVVVDSKGKIESVYIDTTYEGTTKKTLGNDYNMKTFNPSAAGEWFEQVEKLEKAIVENQGTSFITLDNDGKTDAVSGCTIVVDAMIKAVDDALSQAKN